MSAPSAYPTSPLSRRRRLLGEALRQPRRYVAPWYGAYLLLGIVTAGMLPVLLPLMMVAVSHQVSVVAFVLGAYDLGLLTSPLWGLLAERRKAHRAVFRGGLIATAAAVAVMPFGGSMIAWFPISFVMGTGTAAATTVATLFIVDFTARKEWEPRIGWLQSFNGFGQMIGLFAAAAFSDSLFNQGLWLCAALLVGAVAVGSIGLPGVIKRTRRDLPSRLDVQSLAVFPRASLLGGGVLRHSHRLNLAGLRSLTKAIGQPFGHFLLSWFFFCLGIASFFAYFPLLMRKSFGVDPSVTSLVYAVGAGLGVALFVLSSSWAERFGAMLVYRSGLFLRLVAFSALLLLLLLPLGNKTPLAIIGFFAVVLVWPLLSVSATDLTAHLTPNTEGAAMGLFNASGALATVIGTFMVGPLVLHLGYVVVLLMALGGVGCAALLVLRLDPSPEPALEDSSPPSPDSG